MKRQETAGMRNQLKAKALCHKSGAESTTFTDWIRHTVVGQKDLSNFKVSKFQSRNLDDMMI